MALKQLSLLLCCYLVVYAFGESTKLPNVIQALNDKLDATTTMFYTTSNISKELEEALQQQLPPKILASAKAPTHLEDLYNSRVLSVVFLASTFREQLQQLHALLHTNRRFTHELVLFVAYAYEDQRWLFEWCWRHKFLNVLLLTEEHATKFTTYTPFPRFQLFNTTLSTYFNGQFAPRNFRGYPIRFNGGFIAPRSLIFEDDKGELVLHGFLPRLIVLFAHLHNATLQRVRPSKVYNNYECFQMVAQKALDLCMDYYFMGQEIYLTQPLYMYHIHLMVPCAEHIPVFYYIAAPFTLHLWLLIALMLMLLTLILALMCWCRYSSWCVGQLFLDLVAGLLYLPFRLRPFKGCTQRFLFIKLVLTGHLLSTYYLAILSSIFSVHVYENQIKSLSDLKQHNISVLVNEIDGALLQINNASVELLERIQVVSANVLTSNQLALDRRYAYLCTGDKCNMLLNQQKYLRYCSIRVLEPAMVKVFGGIAIGNDTFFESILNVYLLRVFETGIFTHLQGLSHQDTMRMNITKYFHTEDEDIAKPLNMEYLRIPGMVLIVGYVLALMAFFGELVKFYYWK